MKSEQYCYLSPLAKREVLEIISRQNPGFIWSGILGRVRSGNRVEVTHRSGGRNSWNPVFFGTVSEETEGTMLTGEFRTPSSTTVFMWIWRSFVALTFVAGLGSALLPAQYVTGTGSLSGLLIPAGMIVFSFLLEWAGEIMGRGNRKEVLRFFETRLAAHEIDME